MILFAYSALLFSALATTRWLYRDAEQCPADRQTTLRVLCLSYLFIALAALAELFSGLMPSTLTNDLVTLQRMLDNLAFYAAIPLLASPAVATGLGQHWSRPAWGRWLIALFALFELCRRMEYGALYAQILAALCVLAIIASAIRFTETRTRVLGVLSAGGLGTTLLLFSHASLVSGLANSTAYALSLALTVPLFGYTLRHALRP